MRARIEVERKLHSSSVASRMLPWWTKPVQLNRMSTAPACAAAATTASLSSTSSANVRIAGPGDLRHFCAVEVGCDHVRPFGREREHAVARPIPCAAAVQNAVLPASLPAIVFPFRPVDRSVASPTPVRKAASAPACQPRGRRPRAAGSGGSKARACSILSTVPAPEIPRPAGRYRGKPPAPRSG